MICTYVYMCMIFLMTFMCILHIYPYIHKYLCIYIMCDDEMDYSTPGAVHGILQATVVEWVAIPFSRRSSRPRDWTQVSCVELPWWFRWWRIFLQCGRSRFNPWVCRIPWTEGPGGLQSMGSWGVGYSWATNTFSCIAGGFFTVWATRETLIPCNWRSRNPVWWDSLGMKYKKEKSLARGLRTLEMIVLAQREKSGILHWNNSQKTVDFWRTTLRTRDNGKCFQNSEKW